MSAGFAPECVVLLHADPADGVSRALLDGRARLPWPLLPVAARELADVRFGASTWTVGARELDPARCALVNRLPMGDRLDPRAPESDLVDRQAVWTRLRAELGRFGYASSLPTTTSLVGCFGSLVDQWADIPRMVPDVRVPDHSTAAAPRALAGNVHAADRWMLYSLGRPVADPAAAGLAPAARVDYVRPPGWLVHFAQVGRTMFFPNPPPTMTQAQEKAIVEFARALAAVSPIRVIEHAFFVGEGAPVLYSSCPVPMISGGHPSYPELVQQGLRDDIDHCGGRRRS